MAILQTISRGFYVKARPKTYQTDGMSVGGNAGFVLASRPRDYPLTSQQRKVRDVADKCGIKTGISRSELRHKMVECVGPAMRK